MALRGWQINLSGSTIPVYEIDVVKGKKIGNLTVNECFANGQAFGSGYEGWGDPVVFLNSSRKFNTKQEPITLTEVPAVHYLQALMYG